MRIAEAKYSIIQLVEWLRKRELTVNKEYQRSGGLWPRTAKSYFIDTILKGFPFPKIYFHELIDRDLRRPRNEIVDGQQRIGTIVEFLDDAFTLSDNSEYKGLKFSDLTDELKESFLSYPVSVDVIRNADRREILEMFRRMNAYTLPLNEAEKRQSDFFGEFKGWVNSTLDEYGGMLVDWRVFTSRQVLRMLDTEFIADLALAIEQGIVSTSPSKLRAIYKENDENFFRRDLFEERIWSTLDFMRADMGFLAGTHLTSKTHIFFSLICALIHNRWGLPNGETELGLAPIQTFGLSREDAERGLRELASADEGNDIGRFREYVEAASEGGNRAAQRIIRTRWLCMALRGEL